MAALALPVAMRARRIANLARIATTALLAMRGPPALAHGVAASSGAPLTFGWDFTPWLTALLAVSLVLYGVGFARLHARSGTGRSSRRTQALAFAAGWLALALALVSPLDTLSGALFSAHMVEHETMMLVCAPLIVLGRPLGIMLWAFPHGVRLPIGRALRSRVWTACWHRLASPMWAWSLHALALWAWHAPYLFEAALAHPFVHTLQHASFLLTALLFWRGIFGEAATRRASGQAMLSLFTTMVHTGALGALITLAPGVWYPSYIEPTSALGVDPLRDQQLGGLIMWIPGALAYLVGALVVAARWLRERPTASRPAAWLSRGVESPALEEPPR